MEFEPFIFPHMAEESRKDRPDLENLPPKCCVKCREWKETDGNPRIGMCLRHSCRDAGGNCLFTWADDSCSHFEHREREE